MIITETTINTGANEPISMGRTRYQKDFIVNVVVNLRNNSIMETAKQFHLPYSTVAKWRDIYNHPENFPSHFITKYFHDGMNYTIKPQQPELIHNDFQAKFQALQEENRKLRDYITKHIFEQILA